MVSHVLNTQHEPFGGDGNEGDCDGEEDDPEPGADLRLCGFEYGFFVFFGSGVVWRGLERVAVARRIVEVDARANVPTLICEIIFQYGEGQTYAMSRSIASPRLNLRNVPRVASVTAIVSTERSMALKRASSVSSPPPALAIKRAAAVAVEPPDPVGREGASEAKNAAGSSRDSTL